MRRLFSTTSTFVEGWRQRVNALLARGTELMEEEEIEQAQEHFYEALKLQMSHDTSRDSLSLMRQIAMVHLGVYEGDRSQQHELEKAEKLMDSAEALGAQLGEWQMVAEQVLLRGRHLMALDDEDQARKHLERVVKMTRERASLPVPLGVVARSLLGQMETDDAKATALFREAVLGARRGLVLKNEDSVRLLGDACLIWAKYEHKMERMDEAIKLAKTASELLIDIEDKLEAKTVLLHALGMSENRWPETKKVCDELIAMKDCDSLQMQEILIMVSLALHTQGEEDQALEVLDMAKELSSVDPEGAIAHTQKVLRETSKRREKD